jgi:hypothetical protein
MKAAKDLTPSGVRGRLKKYGMDLSEKPGKFVVYRSSHVAEFDTLDELRAFLHGAETVVPSIASGVEE